MFRSGGRPSTMKYEDFEDVSKSDQFGKAPIQNDDAFMHGIVVKAKFIGSMEIPRPKSRPEIISSMRRIRYEYKARNVVKVKVKIRIAVGGLTVTKRTKKKRKRRSVLTDEQPEIILESPIYRVFFVSHDSLDRQIFSFVCRAEVDGGRRCFICAVFKAYKKSHALRIVRTVGQVFDTVCRLQESKDAKNIPGLLPPEKLQKMQEEEKAKEEESEKAREARQEAEEDAKAMEESAADHPPAYQVEQVPQKPLIEFDDNYDMQVKTFEEQQQTDSRFATQQAARVANASQVHQTESEDLMREFGLSVQQQQFLLNNYAVQTGQPSSAQFSAGAAAAGGGSGLPVPPAAGSRGVLAPLQRSPLHVTTNQLRDDSMLMNLDMTDGGDSRELLDGSPIDVYGESSNISPEESKRLLPRLFAMQRAQTAQLQLLQDQLSAETRQRVVAEAKIDHLLKQNKELADHVTWLVQQVKTHAGEAPALPPTNRHIPDEGATAAGRSSALNGFDDSFIAPPATAMTVHNGVPSALSMPTKKLTSSDSESDSGDDDEKPEKTGKRAQDTGAPGAEYGPLGDSTDGEEDTAGQDASSTPAAAATATAQGAAISQLGDFPGQESTAADTERLTFN